MALMRSLQSFRFSSLTFQTLRMSTGGYGSGEGRGGGGGGTIRSAGGAFGEIEAAREEEYFRKLQALQVKKLHDHLEDEVHHNQSEINRLQDELKRRQAKLNQLKEELKDSKK